MNVLIIHIWQCKKFVKDTIHQMTSCHIRKHWRKRIILNYVTYICGVAVWLLRGPCIKKLLWSFQWSAVRAKPLIPKPLHMPNSVVVSNRFCPHSFDFCQEHVQSRNMAANLECNFRDSEKGQRAMVGRCATGQGRAFTFFAPLPHFPPFFLPCFSDFFWFNLTTLLAAMAIRNVTKPRGTLYPKCCKSNLLNIQDTHDL